MQSGISIAPQAITADVQVVTEVAKSLNDLMKTAFDAHLDQANVGRLLEAFQNTASPVAASGHISIANCSVQGDRQFVEVDEDELAEGDDL